MDEIFPDRLLAAIEAKGSPICVGIDPIFEMLPDAIAVDAAGLVAYAPEPAVALLFSPRTAALWTRGCHMQLLRYFRSAVMPGRCPSREPGFHLPEAGVHGFRASPSGRSRSDRLNIS